MPPGATVKLSGCDFASAIRMSAANVACAKPRTKARPAARSRTFKTHMHQISSKSIFPYCPFLMPIGLGAERRNRSPVGWASPVYGMRSRRVSADSGRMTAIRKLRESPLSGERWLLWPVAGLLAHAAPSMFDGNGRDFDLRPTDQACYLYRRSGRFGIGQELF